MALTLTGDGSITGLAAGGLPDLSIGTADIADAAITAAKMSGAQSGDAPIYGARAWVNFNGTFGSSPFTVANGGIRAAGNVTSVTDNGTGDYTINFSVAMPDANYALTGSGRVGSGVAAIVQSKNGGTFTSTASQILSTNSSATAVDLDIVSVSVFR